MLDFVFFHPTPQQLFIDWLQQRNLQPETSVADEIYQVRLPEDIDDVLYEAIEEQYERLMEMNEELMKEEHAGDKDYHMAGISVHLQDGNVSYADIDPDLLGRVMGAITAEEFARLVDAIVTAVEHPQSRTYCQRMRRDEA